MGYTQLPPFLICGCRVKPQGQCPPQQKQTSPESQGWEALGDPREKLPPSLQPTQQDRPGKQACVLPQAWPFNGILQPQGLGESQSFPMFLSTYLARAQVVAESRADTKLLQVLFHPDRINIYSSLWGSSGPLRLRVLQK